MASESASVAADAPETGSYLPTGRAWRYMSMSQKARAAAQFNAELQKFQMAVALQYQVETAPDAATAMGIYCVAMDSPGREQMAPSAPDPAPVPQTVAARNFDDGNIIPDALAPNSPAFDDGYAAGSVFCGRAAVLWG